MTDWAWGVDRIGWDEIPARVRAEIEARLGARVVGVRVPAGGFSHGMAAVLELDDGRRVFAKAIAGGDRLAGHYRTESATAGRLPKGVPTPRMLFALEAESWIVTVFEEVVGRHPQLNRPSELAAVVRAVEQLAEMLTPNPLDGVPTIAESFGEDLTGWRHFARDGVPSDLDGWSRRNVRALAELESTWVSTSVGNTLLHTDIRPDNMMLRADGTVLVVDWAWPCVGAAWVDVVTLVPSMLGAGVDPGPLLATNPLTAHIDSAVVDAFVCALAGYWARNSRLPAPPRSPMLRTHQAEKARVTIAWLAERLGWR
ncbi:phosphotransferase family protein [Nocardia sp. NPDC056000]|uniref:phosphotransferase family protein n=1 Tax=Nocardia sp. NPDC056000 TaxID=3345674 RepID=UPI0035D9665D